MVNIHANTILFSLTANSPNTHVTPINGNKIMAAFSDALHQEYKELSLAVHTHKNFQSFANLICLVWYHMLIFRLQNIGVYGIYNLKALSCGKARVLLRA